MVRVRVRVISGYDVMFNMCTAVRTNFKLLYDKFHPPKFTLKKVCSAIVKIKKAIGNLILICASFLKIFIQAYSCRLACLKVIDTDRTKVTETLSVGRTELGLRGIKNF